MKYPDAKCSIEKCNKPSFQEIVDGLSMHWRCYEHRIINVRCHVCGETGYCPNLPVDNKIGFMCSECSRKAVEELDATVPHYKTEHGTVYTGPPADSWQTSLFGGPCAESLAAQGELFGSHEYSGKVIAKGPRIKDLPGQTMMF